MIEKMIVGLVKKLAENKLIAPKDREYYTYAGVCLAEKFITIGTIVLISFIIKMVIPTCIFLTFFLSLRKRTGGYHLNSFGQCYFGTIIAYLLILSISGILADYPVLLFGMLLSAFGLIIIIGTVNHPNLHMNEGELAESKKAARLMIVLEGSVIGFMILIGADMLFISYMSNAIILCAVLLCAAKILKQEAKEEDGENQQEIIESSGVCNQERG